MAQTQVTTVSSPDRAPVHKRARSVRQRKNATASVAQKGGWLVISLQALRLALSVSLLVAAFVFPAAAQQRAPSGRVVIAWHVTIAPAWFDPSTAPPQITPFGML
jgi:hypothetical protein